MEHGTRSRVHHLAPPSPKHARVCVLDWKQHDFINQLVLVSTARQYLEEQRSMWLLALFANIQKEMKPWARRRSHLLFQTSLRGPLMDHPDDKAKSRLPVFSPRSPYSGSPLGSLGGGRWLLALGTS